MLDCWEFAEHDDGVSSAVAILLTNVKLAAINVVIIEYFMAVLS
jgi:hypothetical protein